MARESNITAVYRCDSQETKNHLCEAFVPPRPRDRHRLKKGDSRAGYWCRRTAFLAKEVAVANREARKAKEMIPATQEQMKEIKQLIAGPLKQGLRELAGQWLWAQLNPTRVREPNPTRARANPGWV